MLSTLKVNNQSHLRQVLFAHSFLSPDVPKRWEIMADFASRGDEEATFPHAMWSPLQKFVLL